LFNKKEERKKSERREKSKAKELNKKEAKSKGRKKQNLPIQSLIYSCVGVFAIRAKT